MPSVFASYQEATIVVNIMANVGFWVSAMAQAYKSRVGNQRFPAHWRPNLTQQNIQPADSRAPMRVRSCTRQLHAYITYIHM